MAGSEWHIASDMLPLPHILGCIFHVIWVIIFGSLIGAYDVFRTCKGQGGNYVAADAGLLTVFCVLILCELAVIFIGLRGKYKFRDSSETSPFGSGTYLKQQTQHTRIACRKDVSLISQAF